MLLYEMKYLFLLIGLGVVGYYVADVMSKQNVGK